MGHLKDLEISKYKRFFSVETLKYLNINENRKDVDRYKFVVLFLLIVVLFGFLNIKSVKIYATTLLLYKLDTLLLKQKKRPVFGFHLSTHAEKEICYIQYGQILLYCILYMLGRIIRVGTMPGNLKFILKYRVSHV